MNVGYLPGILLVLSVLIAVHVYDSYGISWDEANQREIGLVNTEYVLGINENLLDYKDRDYGSLFEMSLLALENVFNKDGFRDVFLFRHFVSHLFFIIGGLFCFLLVNLLYHNKLLSVFSFLLWVLMPVFYAHSFFNTKDIPFATMMMIAFYYSALTWKRPTWFNYVFLAVIFAILINFRLMGLVVPFGFSIIVLLKQFVFERNKFWQIKSHSKLLVLFGVVVLVLYLSWPFLWLNPLDNFFFALKNMARFRWRGEMLFAGEILVSNALPWYYTSIWFSIQTPILYLFFGILSWFILGKKIFSNLKSTLKSDTILFQLLFFICFFVPLVIVIILKSTLYDGWRQMFFIYVPFLMMIVFSLDYLIKFKYGKLIYVFLGIYFGTVLFEMYQYHPYQHVYFNEVLSLRNDNENKALFEMDYWGTSYKEQLEFLEKTFPNDTLKLNFDNKPGELNLRMLPEGKKNRFVVTDCKDADYFLTNHRNGYSKVEGESIYKVLVKNKIIGEIFRIKNKE